MAMLVILVLVGVGMWFASSRTLKGFVWAGVLVGAAVAVEALRRRSRTKLSLNVSPRGVAWIHPDRGSGMLNWADVGAVVLRDTGDGGEALCLVPRNGPAEDTFVLSAGDFGLPPGEGEARLRGFVEQVKRFLPEDVVLDRAMKKKLAEWGL